MSALRPILFGLGLVILVSTLAVDEPEVFRLRGPAAVLAFVVGAGAVAADGVPLRRAAAACSAATMVLGLASLVQLPGQAALGALIALLQLVPWGAARLKGRWRLV